MSQLLDTSLVSAALRMAINQRHYSQNLIVHSDRGAQFASAAYRRLSASTANRFDESKRQLLRQCFYRKLL